TGADRGRHASPQSTSAAGGRSESPSRASIHATHATHPRAPRRREQSMATTPVEPQLKLPQLPTRELGLNNLPAFPTDTPGRLGVRFKQRAQALEGLSKTYTIGGRTARAREFLFGDVPLDAKEAEQLEHLRGLLKGDTMDIIPSIVEAIVGQTESMATSFGEL